MKPSKEEGALKSAFGRELKRQLPHAVTVLHSTTGAADRAVTFGGLTTYLEFKHGTPAFDSPGIQELFCMRLEVTGRCRYVVWQENAKGNDKHTLIVRPKMIHEREGWNLVAEETFAGFDHRATVSWLRRFHGF